MEKEKEYDTTETIEVKINYGNCGITKLERHSIEVGIQDIIKSQKMTVENIRWK